MSKSDKQRVGLQRKVSSVFKGVAIPGKKHTGEPSGLSPVPTDDNGVTLPEAMPENGLIPKIRRSEEGISPSIPVEPETMQSPASEDPEPIEKAADNVDPKKTAEPAPPLSKTPQTAQSSLMKRLAQSDEPEDVVVSSQSSVEEEPEVAQASANEKAVCDKSGDSVQQAPNKQKTPQSSLMKRLAQSEEPANETVSDNKADLPLPKTPKREPSLNHKLKKDRKPEASPVSTAQNKHPLADQFADAAGEEGFLQRIKEKLIPSEAEGGSAKDKVMVMLVPILAIVMVFMFRNVLIKSPNKASAAKKKDEKVVAAVMSGDEIEWKIPDSLPLMTRDPLQLPQQNDTENPDEVAGPTNPEQETATTAAQIRSGVVNVRTIVYSEDKASALIGDQIVYAGSKIDGVTIVKINRDSVEFESNGETWVQKVRD
jgi:hypothetical protein